MAKSKKVPAGALQFKLGAFEFAEPAGDSKNVPVKMVARTGDPIYHWYWGKVVHDLDGMKLHKPTLPIDYCHDPAEVLGYLDKFDKSSGDLVVTGAVTPFRDDDRASEVLHKQRAGVPYESSISFIGGILRLEELREGATTTVNGRKLDGPATIIREWGLRGVAICPYGADKNTTTEFKGDAAGEVTVEVTELAAPATENPMGNQAPAAGAAPTGAAVMTNTAAEPAKPAIVPPGTGELTTPAGGAAPAPAATAPAAPAGTGELTTPAGEPAPAKPAGDHAQYVAAFGDVGARWYLEGRSFSDCATEQLTKLRETHAAELAGKDTEISRLQALVDAAPRGDAGVTFSSGEKDPGQAGQQYAGKLAPGIARFAAGIKMPGTAAAR